MGAVSSDSAERGSVRDVLVGAAVAVLALAVVGAFFLGFVLAPGVAALLLVAAAIISELARRRADR
jgi:hypothetical protein